MNDRQRQSEFLRQCLLYDADTERHKLAEGIRQVQRNERLVRRAAWFMVVLASLAFAGLVSLTAFVPDFSESLLRFIARVFCVIGLGSLICIPAFVGLEIVYRKELNARREECRQLVASLLESRLGKPGAQNGQNGARPETSDRNGMQTNPGEKGITGRRFEA